MCDTLCVVGDGRTLFAKNSDRPRAEAQLLEARPRRVGGGDLATTHLTIADEGAYALVGSRPAWCWGLEHGVNEHRVAIGNERVYTRDDPRAAAPALIGMDLVRLGLERARCADEAVEVMTRLLERHGQGGRCRTDRDEAYFSSFLIADPRGAWVLETSGRSWAAARRDDGAAISNGLTLGDDWSTASVDVPVGSPFDARRDAEHPTGPADRRRAVTAACVAAGAAALEPGDLVSTLRDHGEAPWGHPGRFGAVSPLTGGAGDEVWSVCLHLPDLGLATTASLVAELPADPGPPLRAWAGLASPCASIYVPLFPPASPPMLAEPQTWGRFARLRDRVEAEPGALAEIRGELAAVEAQLWADADTAGHDEEHQRAVVDASGAAVHAVLARLGV
jgi:secernin